MLHRLKICMDEAINMAHRRMPILWLGSQVFLGAVIITLLMNYPQSSWKAYGVRVRIEKFVSLSTAVIGKSSLSFFSGAFKVNQLKQQCAQFSVCMCDEIQDKCRLLSRL